MQADLMEHSRGCVLDYYLQECSCQTCKNDPACFYCPFSSSSQEHWEINHIISHTHIAPSSIILSTANCKANNNFVQFTKFTCCLIASKIGRMWTLLILTVENEITFFFYKFTSVMEMRLNNIAVELHWAHTKTCLWDWTIPLKSVIKFVLPFRTFWRRVIK